MKKKIITVLLTVALCFTLCACDSSTGTSSTFKSQTINNALNNPKVKFGGLLD